MGVLANPDLYQAMVPSKQKRARAVLRASSARRSASTSKPRFGGEKVRLGDCFPYIKNGYNVRQGKDKGGMPITRIETLSDNRFNRDKVGYADIFSTEGLENHILEDGDILMSHINSLPYLGRSVMYRARPGEVFIHGMNLLRLKADRSVVEPGYAELYFRSPRFKQHVLKIAKKAVNQASFSVSDLKEIEFPLMSLCDQHDVIEKLSSVTTQIEHCQRAIGKLDSLVKSRFVEIFGDPCDPGNSSAKSRIDSFCELRIGPFGSVLHKEDYITGGHPLVNPSHIIGGAIRSDENLTIDDGKYESLAAYHLLPGDVVLGRRGEIGRCAVVKTDGLICGTGSMIIRPGQKVRSDYLQRVVSFPSFSHALEANAVGVTMKNLNAKIVGSAEVFLPDLEDQDAFISFVSQVDKSRFVQDHEMNFRWERFTLSWSTIA